jgi:hypothetical protein
VPHHHPSTCPEEPCEKSSRQYQGLFVGFFGQRARCANAEGGCGCIPRSTYRTRRIGKEKLPGEKKTPLLALHNIWPDFTSVSSGSLWVFGD